MKALLVTAPHTVEIRDVEAPEAKDGHAVVDVTMAGVCGTDTALFAGDPARLAHHRSSLPLQLGHEWVGVVSAVGAGVDNSWIGRRVSASNIIGCGGCENCQRGRANLCPERHEIGVRRNWPGAFAEQVLVPVASLHHIPDRVTDEQAAFVEPGANSWRGIELAAVRPGDRLLVIGPGTLGVLAAQLGMARGAEVHVLGRSDGGLELARESGVTGAWSAGDLPDLPFTAVIDASDAATMPSLAAERVAAGGRIVLLGVSKEPSLIDSRALVRKEVTVHGVMGGLQGIRGTIEAFAAGHADPAPLVRGVLSLQQLADWFMGREVTLREKGTKVLTSPSSVSASTATPNPA